MTEATSLLFGDVTRFESHLVVRITESKTDQGASGHSFFAAACSDKSICPVALFDKYKAMVPDPGDGTRLFRQIHAGKFTRQCVGESFFMTLPRLLAATIWLPNAGKF